MASYTTIKVTSELFQRKSHPRFLVLCQTQPAVAVAAYEGIQDAMKECRENMYYNLWDCSQVNTILHDPPFLRSGTKEAAYLWALSSAGAAWGVATACAAGWLSECACDVTVGNKLDYEWGGCLQGVNYGLKMSRKILSRPSDGTLLRAIEKHSLKVGRIMVRKTLVQDCKCHGVSGSCDQKTCYHKPAHLRTIATHLTRKFFKAKKVSQVNLKNKNTELIYADDSPDPCLTAATLNRVCAWSNETHHKGDCKRLCCGRGHKVTF
uniref:Protein Wnt n=1 Tax=Syphacia muris TaxID=451379 RepID=A0A0N5A7S8_9BILA